MNVRAPTKGYDHPEKAAYRDAVCKHLAPAALEAINEDSDAVAVILPSMEGLEIKTAIANGVPEDRIVCVDSSPAKIATSKWRKEHPSCKFYGSMLSVAASKMSKDGLRPCVVNMDFCTNFSTELLLEASSFLQKHRGSLRRWAVTIAKGREGPALTEMVKRFGRSGLGEKIDDARTAAMFTLIEDVLSDSTHVCGQGQYRISRTQMSWTVFDSGHNEMQEIKRLIQRYSRNHVRLYRLAAKQHNYITSKAESYQSPLRQRDIERKVIEERNAKMGKIEFALMRLSEPSLIAEIQKKFLKEISFDVQFRQAVNGPVRDVLSEHGFDPLRPGHLFRRRVSV